MGVACRLLNLISIILWSRSRRVLINDDRSRTWDAGHDEGRGTGDHVTNKQSLLTRPVILHQVGGHTSEDYKAAISTYLRPIGRAVPRGGPKAVNADQDGDASLQITEEDVISVVSIDRGH